mmetsp:Transcript_50445/g.80580  ORF Transcript_50445/g.80580 Transcript_50445/m.80580 type:complete len:117 (+) Transcript_50445:35-385(+)
MASRLQERSVSALAGSAAGPAVLRPATVFPSVNRRRPERRPDGQVQEALSLPNRWMIYPSQRHLGAEEGLALSFDRGRVCVTELQSGQGAALAATSKAIHDLPQDHLEWARRQREQ